MGAAIVKAEVLGLAGFSIIPGPLGWLMPGFDRGSQVRDGLSAGGGSHERTRL